MTGSRRLTKDISDCVNDEGEFLKVDDNTGKLVAFNPAVEYRN